MKKNFFLYFSLILLGIIGTILGYKSYHNYWIGMLSAIAIIIPALYSIIPMIKEQKYLSYSQKNRLTDTIFTDREEDLKDIIRILNIQEHCIQITGNGEQCGKSWMAKRLCDYINHPKDEIFKNLKLKCPYIKADYLDMENYNEDTLNTYFQTKIINSKTVLIFDNVTDFKMILSKQKIFHFQMVYILKQDVNHNLSVHKMSSFPIEHIEQLQWKIKEVFSGINMLSSSEVEVLYNLTDGNIGKIVALLSEQKCVSWIKDIGNQQQTDYDVELQKIQIQIFMGKYQDADIALQEFYAQYGNNIQNNNDLMYKYYLINSDCKHMLNEYSTAINILSIIEIPVLKKYNHNFAIELHKSHYYKHLWKCNEALDILAKIKNSSYDAIVDSLGILAAKYFINDLYVPESEETSLVEFLNYYSMANNSQLSHSSNSESKLKRYAALYHYYTQKPENENTLIETIDQVIDIYKKENNRLLANAYFIKAEIYRVYRKYEKATNEYKRCLTVTIDENIKLQTNLIILYLKNINKINVDFPLLSENEISDMCQKNLYSSKVLKNMHCIELKDPNADELKQCFENRIMPIL